jgi:single-strand DNA-binding protein
MGSRVVVLGVLDQQTWQSKEGGQRSSFQVIANSIEFLSAAGQRYQNI